VVVSDLKAVNGVVHGIDRVLWPNTFLEQKSQPMRGNGPLF
jgi:hypothetical protein